MGLPMIERVVVISERLGPLTDQDRRTESAGAQLRSAPLWSADEISRNAAGAAVVVIGAVEPFDALVLESLPDLAAVVRRGVGYDNVDVDAASRLGIAVANVPDASVEEVSDHALSMLLSIERAVPWLDSAVRAGAWTTDPSGIQAIRSRSRRLSSLAAGVVGLGRIGQALVRKARGVYGEILASDPAVSVEAGSALGVAIVPLQELLRQADHITLHAPLIPGTHHMVNAQTLAEMRTGAVLVNTSRGGLVDPDALVDAVHNGHLAGAGLCCGSHGRC